MTISRRFLIGWTHAVAMIGATVSGVDADSQTVTREAAVGLPAVPTVRILAIGHLTTKATPDALRAILPHEVQETVRLQLAGKIDQWYTRKDQPGVVFVMNTSDMVEARRLLDALSLGKAGLMEFDLIPLGRLAPLGLLLSPTPG